MKNHELKLSDKFYNDVMVGTKNFEIRFNDRGFQKGDFVKFIEVDKLGCITLRESNNFEITYVLNGYGLKGGYVVFGLIKA